MAIFLTDADRDAIKAVHRTSPFVDVYWAFLRRAQRRAEEPGLRHASDTVAWWHCVAEHLTCGSMAWAIKPDDTLATWVRSNTLTVVRRPVSDWVGPDFRDHDADLPVGHLETAHLCWAVAAALDLAGDVFTPTERDEIAAALRDKGLVLCQRWLAGRTRFNNWRAILNSGVAMAAAVLDDRDALQQAAAHFTELSGLWQDDGSYGESLQYGNYAALGMTYTAEAILRRDPELGGQLDVTPYARKVRWDAASHFYTKPLGGDGWGAEPRARAANFNDSAAIYAPSADVLLHIAARARQSAPTEAGLASSLFHTHYLDALSAGPTDRASFGFVNRIGFLTLPLLAVAAAPIDAATAGLTACEAFDCGDVILRDRWNGTTVVATHGGGEPLRATSHQHGDLNSGIVAHDHERLLLDPGHCTYRSLIHTFDRASFSHNTCTFTRDADNAVMEQIIPAARDYEHGHASPETQRGARRLIATSIGDVRVAASDAADAYDPVIRRFARFWILCGSHALFVVDHIISREPVRTTWHWLLNNRDGGLDLKRLPPDRLVARRGNVGMKMFHLGDSTMSGPLYAHVHDAYHPLPAQVGEGRPGSGLLMQWQEKQAQTERLVAHGITMHGVGKVTGWHLRTQDNQVTLEGPAASEVWTLHLDRPDALRLVARHTGTCLDLVADTTDTWSLTPSTSD